MNKDEVVAKIQALAPLLITIVALVNSFLTLKGLPAIEIGNEIITTLVNSFATIVGTVWCWWSNNNFTRKAQTAQPVLNLLKEDKITTEQVNNFVQDAQSDLG